jgi:hypothetical protein
MVVRVAIGWFRLVASNGDGDAALPGFEGS